MNYFFQGRKEVNQGYSIFLYPRKINGMNPGNFFHTMQDHGYHVLLFTEPVVPLLSNTASGENVVVHTCLVLKK